MQRQNANPINIQHKCSVIIKKPKYLLNDGFSWIIAAIENGKLNENSTEQDIFKLKLELVAETEKRLNQFLRSDSNKKGILFDPCPYCIDIPYFIIGDNLNRINWKSGNYITDNLSSSNDRLLTCSVTQEINNGWTCNFTLDNTNDIYTLKNLFKLNFKQDPINCILNQANTCVIEPNDEVEVYMSDWQGELHCVFTGFISSVSMSDDGLRKVINVSCNDILKKLTWHYFNAQAGFDVKEARGVLLSVYSENQQPMKLNKVVATLLGETYCDIYKRDSFLLELVKMYAQAYKKIQQLGENNPEARKSQNVAIENINKRILKEIDEYVKPDKGFDEIIENGQIQYIASNSNEGIYGKKCTIDYGKLITQQTIASEIGIKDNTKIQTPFLDYGKGELIFKIEGENQPIWEWTIKQGGYDYLFSNYKRNDEVIKNIASITQYEFFANATGIIYFRPPNFVLPRTSIAEGIADGELVKQVNEYIQNNYWVTNEKEQYFTQFNSSINDNNIYTRVNVIGKWTELGYSNEFMRSAGYASQWWLNKYGLRMMSTNTRTGLTKAETCKTYAEMLLWKNNINYELCDATCLLNSNYTIGLPIFIERQLAVWYVGRVTHTFTSGSGCTTSLTLTYKRTPMCLRKDLQQYMNDNLNWGKLNQTEYDYIKRYEEFLSWGFLDINLVKTFPIAEPGKTNVDGLLVGNTLNKGIMTRTAYKEDYMFVWTPIPNALYLLTMELQNQVDLLNNVNNNFGKTIINTTIKKSKQVGIVNIDEVKDTLNEEYKNEYWKYVRAYGKFSKPFKEWIEDYKNNQWMQRQAQMEYEERAAKWESTKEELKEGTKVQREATKDVIQFTGKTLYGLPCKLSNWLSNKYAEATGKNEKQKVQEAFKIYSENIKQ